MKRGVKRGGLEEEEEKARPVPAVAEPFAVATTRKPSSRVGGF